jgi:hypothetical protein
MINEEDMVIVKAEMPVAESFGLADELRSSTQGQSLLGNTVQPMGASSRIHASGNNSPNTQETQRPKSNTAKTRRILRRSLEF